MLAIFKRDMMSYFTTPLGYVFMAVFLAVNGGVFSLFTLQSGTDSDVSGYFTAMIFALMVVIPLLTMKVFSEEKKQRTEQLLMTAPISLGGMVFGKFLAAYTVFAGTFLVGCFNFVALYKFAAYDQPNGAALLGSTVAVLLVGAAFVSMGLFISSLTENQFVAAIGTIALMGGFLVVGMLNSYIPFAWLREVLSWLSIYSRFGTFTYGIFDFNAILYYASISFVFLFLTVRIYEKRRWA